VALAVAVVVIGLIVWFSVAPPGGRGGASAAPVTVVTAPVRRGTFVVYQSAPGTVKPADRVVVRSGVAGQVAKIAFTGGQMVKKGDLLAAINPSSSAAQRAVAKGNLARDKTLLRNAKDTLKRYKALRAKHSIAPQKVDAQQALVSQYQADVRADQLHVSHARITAPIGGRVGLPKVDPGNAVSPSDAIAVITRMRPAGVVFAVSADVAPALMDQLAAGACIPVVVYGKGQEDKLGTGRLAAANNGVDPATGTVKLQARFPNDHGTALPDEFVTVQLPVQTLPGATLVPSAAIQQGRAGPFVYAVVDQRTAQVTPVQVGPGNGTTTVVTGGITPGARVVIQGAGRLRDGTRVKPTRRNVQTEGERKSQPACPRAGSNHAHEGQPKGSAGDAGAGH
jgi:multidrug efflux system membrane fusion protein